MSPWTAHASARAFREWAEGLLHGTIRMSPLMDLGRVLMTGWEARIKRVVTEGFQMQTLDFFLLLLSLYCISVSILLSM